MIFSRISTLPFGILKYGLRGFEALSYSNFRFREFSSAMESSQRISSVLDDHDATQVKLLEEQCLLVDDKDRVIGSATKKDCHLLENIKKGMLHRAFSVFLFNGQRQLLLQQRSSAKITFPEHYTNTCCSHPLNEDGETDENEALGVKRAAQRKLQHELGIHPSEAPIDAFNYITRVRYSAENVPVDGVFGEHEIDYILFIVGDVTVKPNENEVKSVKYLTLEEVRNFVAESNRTGALITPWFRLIAESNLLYKWWTDLETVTKHEDHQTIHKL